MRSKQLIDAETDRQAVAADVKASAEQLAMIEDVKSKLPGDDPRLLSLAQRAQDLAADMVVKTAEETALVRDRRG